MNLPRPRRLLVLLAGALALAALAGGGGGGARPARALKKTPAPATRSVQAEIMLTADRAHWRPGKRGSGTLVLDDVDPRMAVMAVAPRREAVVVPSSMLAANWKALFGKHGNETNVILSLKLEGRPQLVPFRARLFSRLPLGAPSPRRLPAPPGSAPSLDTLGRKRATYAGVSVLVDPTITDAIKSLWNAIVSIFSGTTYDPPPRPDARRERGGALLRTASSTRGRTTPSSTRPRSARRFRTRSPTRSAASWSGHGRGALRVADGLQGALRRPRALRQAGTHRRERREHAGHGIGLLRDEAREARVLERRAGWREHARDVRRLVHGRPDPVRNRRSDRHDARLRDGSQHDHELGLRRRVCEPGNATRRRQGRWSGAALGDRRCLDGVPEPRLRLGLLP